MFQLRVSLALGVVAFALVRRAGAEPSPPSASEPPEPTVVAFPVPTAAPAPQSPDDYFVTAPLRPAPLGTGAAPTMWPPPLLERRSGFAMVTGIVFTSVGGLTVTFVGAGALFGGEPSGDSQGRGVNSDDRDQTARGALVGGLVCIAVGIPLIIYGAKRVPTWAAKGNVSFQRGWAGEPTSRGWGWRF